MVGAARSEAFQAGLKPAEFLACTPFETYEWCKAQAQRECSAYKLALFEAWHTAVFQRQKKLPNLSKIMKRLDQPTPIKCTPDELARKARQITLAMGGTVKHG